MRWKHEQCRLTPFTDPFYAVHGGPKRGNGAYWGYKWEAKKKSNRIRRENWKREIRNALAGCNVVKPSRAVR